MNGHAQRKARPDGRRKLFAISSFGKAKLLLTFSFCFPPSNAPPPRPRRASPHDGTCRLACPRAPPRGPGSARAAGADHGAGALGARVRAGARRQGGERRKLDEPRGLPLTHRKPLISNDSPKGILDIA
jgi:hypothetical protein